MPIIGAEDAHDRKYTHVLSCAACGMENVHHMSVEVFSRKQDAEEGTHTIVDGYGKKIGVDDDMSRNPSARRHGIRIKYHCENSDCFRVSELIILQHKGVTYMYTEPTADVVGEVCAVCRVSHHHERMGDSPCGAICIDCWDTRIHGIYAPIRE